MTSNDFVQPSIPLCIDPICDDVDITGTSATLVAAASNGQWLQLTNQGSATVFISTTSPATVSDVELRAGETIYWPCNAALYGITGGTSVTVRKIGGRSASA